MTLKPQDVMILLRIVLLQEQPWSYSSLAEDLFMSSSETHAGVRRAEAARLFDPARKIVFRRALTEFLIHGVKYAYPPWRGGQTRGTPTGYAAPPLVALIAPPQGDPPVWPAADGAVRGYEFSPLYESAPRAAASNPDLYALLALVDAIRDGRARETELAVRELKSRLGQS